MKFQSNIRFRQNIKKYQLDISIRHISVDSLAKSKNLEKLLKTAMFRPNLTAGYQPDISRQGYQGFLYTRYHELLPLGENAYNNFARTRGWLHNF